MNSINALSKALSAHPRRASLAASLALTLLIVLLPACVSKSVIKASIWMNTPLPSELCEEKPELKQYGVYRKLNSGKYEFLSYCDPKIAEWLSIWKTDLETILGETLPKKDVDFILH